MFLATPISLGEVLLIAGAMSFTFLIGWVFGALVSIGRENDE